MVEICDALDEAQAEFSPKVYPNPVKDKLTLLFNSDTETELTLLNHLGQQVFRSSLVGFNPEIDLSALPSGIYIMSMCRNAQTVCKRIVKE
jgi:hypothetical protein